MCLETNKIYNMDCLEGMCCDRCGIELAEYTKKEYSYKSYILM